MGADSGLEDVEDDCLELCTGFETGPGLAITVGLDPEPGFVSPDGLVIGAGFDPEPGLTDPGLETGTGFDPELGLTDPGLASGLFGGAMGCLGGRLAVDWRGGRLVILKLFLNSENICNFYRFLCIL